jgi:type I restriction enzyme S subunit
MSDLPVGWARVALQDAAHVRLGRQRSPKNHVGPNMRPYLRAANVGWSGLLLDDVNMMNFSEDEASTYELVSGDVVMSEASGSIGEVGKPGVWRGQIPGCCFQNTLIRIRSRGVIDPDFLAHRLRLEALLARWADGTARGVGIHHLGSTRLAVWEIELPPAREQSRIVAELERRLSHIDAAVAGLRIAAKRLSAARDSVLWSAVIPHTTAQSKDDGLPSLPAGWAWSVLGDVADVAGGVTKDSKKQDDPTFVEVPYLRVANVQRGFLDLTQVTNIRVSPEKAQALRLVDGDILFNEGGDRDKLGRGWVWEGQIADCIHQNHVFRARLREPRLHPKFVSWVGNTFGRRWFEAAGKQTTNLASINMTALRTFPVPLPPAGLVVGLVAETERRLSLIDAAERIVAANLRRAAQLRKSLLFAAFSGQLVAQDPADEPASVLLEQNRAERTAGSAPRSRRTTQTTSKEPAA